MAMQKPRSTGRARLLRRADTVAEQKLWESLRARRLKGLKFVRQLPIGPFYADFACREERIIVEVDGVTHSTEKEVAHDEARDTFLRNEGFQIIRVWNEEVYSNLEGVLETILHATGKF